MVSITQPPASLAAKRWLQAAVALAACVPVVGGLAGVVRGAAFVHAAGSVTLDSHFRYLSGLLLGLGLLFWSAIPHIERRGPLIRALSLIVVIGGLARAWSLISMGPPDTSMRLALIMELGVTPLLCLCQYWLAGR